MANDKYLVYVEDDEDDLSLVEEIMDNKKNYSLVTLNDGQELLEFLADNRDGDMPFLIIMDNNIPKMSGIEIADVLKKDDLYQNIPIVILTTAASKSDVEKLQQNNIRVITKPSTFPQWETLIQSFLV